MNEDPVYVISIAARMVPLHAQTLRHYERVGLVKPARSKGQIRLYSEQDIERVRRIQKIIEDLGVNLAGVEVILNMQEKMEQLQSEHDDRVAHMRSAYEEEIQRLRSIIGRIQQGDPVEPGAHAALAAGPAGGSRQLTKSSEGTPW